MSWEASRMLGRSAVYSWLVTCQRSGWKILCRLFVRSGIRTVPVSLRYQYGHSIGSAPKYLLKALAKTISSISHAFGYILNLRIDEAGILDDQKTQTILLQQKSAPTLLRGPTFLHSRIEDRLWNVDTNIPWDSLEECTNDSLNIGKEMGLGQSKI
jgi:hypothetical protein